MGGTASCWLFRCGEYSNESSTRTAILVLKSSRALVEFFYVRRLADDNKTIGRIVSRLQRWRACREVTDLSLSCSVVSLCCSSSLLLLLLSAALQLQQSCPVTRYFYPSTVYLSGCVVVPGRFHALSASVHPVSSRLATTWPLLHKRFAFLLHVISTRLCDVVLNQLFQLL